MNSQEESLFSLGLALGRNVHKEFGFRSRVILGCNAQEQNNGLLYRLVKGLKQGGIIQMVSAGHSNGDTTAFHWGVSSEAFVSFFAIEEFSLGMYVHSYSDAGFSLHAYDYHGKSIDIDSLVVENNRNISQSFDEEEYQLLTAELMHTSLRSIITAKYKEYMHMIEGIFEKLQKSFTIVIGCGDESFGYSYEKKGLEEISKKFGHTIVFIETQESRLIAKEVVSHSADMGCVFDYYSQAISFFDKNGNHISTDLTITSIIDQVLKNTDIPKTIVYDAAISSLVKDTILQNKGRAIIGHASLEHEHVTDALIIASHDRGCYFTEIGSYSLLMSLGRMLRVLDHGNVFPILLTSKKLYYKPEVIHYTINDVTVALESIKTAFKNSEQNYTDGVRVNGAGWWLLVRGSNTEQKVKFYAETRNQEQYEELRNKIEKILFK